MAAASCSSSTETLQLNSGGCGKNAARGRNFFWGGQVGRSEKVTSLRRSTGVVSSPVSIRGSRGGTAVSLWEWRGGAAAARVDGGVGRGWGGGGP